MSETEIIFVIEGSPEGGFEARALGHSIFTQGNSLEDLKAMIRDAVNCHFNRGITISETIDSAVSE